MFEDVDRDNIDEAGICEALKAEGNEKNALHIILQFTISSVYGKI